MHRLALLVFTGVSVCANAQTITTFDLRVDARTCGRISANGVVLVDGGPSPAVTFRWDWGDGTTGFAFFPAEHRYTKDGTYQISMEVLLNGQSLGRKATSIGVTGASAPGCDALLYVHPSRVVLQAGATSAQLSAALIDKSGQRTSLRGSDLTFRSFRPDLISIANDGTVSATGFGSGMVEVTHPYTGNRQNVMVIAGQLRLEPPYLRLSMINPSGRLRVIGENADGSPLALAGRKVVISATQNKSDATADVQRDGSVIAHRPAVKLGDIVFAQATVDGEIANNSAIIRVADAFADLPFAELRSGRIAYEYATQIAGFQVDPIIKGFDVPRWTAFAQDVEEFLAGFPTFREGLHYMVNEVGGSNNPDDTSIPCGGSGNPTQLGANPVKNTSCLVVTYEPVHPQWFIFFHELGHDVTGQSYRFNQFASAGTTATNIAYGEGLASSAAMFTGEIMRKRADSLRVPANVLQSLGWQNAYAAPYWTAALTNYENNGANYASIDANVIDGIIARLMVENGIDWYFRFASVFVPATQAYEFTIDGPAQQATFFVAAVSSAMGSDLRQRFREWGFPVDDAYYGRIQPSLLQLASQRPRPVMEESVVLSAAANAASYKPGSVSPSAWITVAGTRLANGTVISGGAPSTLLGDTRMSVTGSDGVERRAMLNYVSPQALSFLAPPGLPPGAAVLRVQNGFGESALSVDVSSVAPGLFAANSNGAGPAAATWLRVDRNGARTEGYTFTLADAGSRTNTAVSLGGPEDQVYISLYGTGFRNQKSASVTIGGAPAPVYGAVAHPTSAGLDQLVVGPVPRELAGKTDVPVQAVFNGIATNTLTLSFAP